MYKIRSNLEQIVVVVCVKKTVSFNEQQGEPTPVRAPTATAARARDRTSANTS